MKFAFGPGKDVSGPAPALPGRGISLEAHRLIGAELEPKISDLKQLRRRCTLRKNAHDRRTSGLAIRRKHPLHFEKDRRRGSSGDATRTVMEKGTKSSGSARHRQIRLLALQNQWHQAVLPDSDLLAESLAQERRSDGSAVEQDGINARAITEEFGKMPRYRAVGRIRKPPFP